MSQEIKSFYPPLRTLMGPGPSDVHPRVLAAIAKPTIGHLDPAFQDLMEDIKSGLRYAFQTENSLTFPVSAPGSAGMEACFVNLVEPGDKVIIAQNGVFGVRMKENVVRCGGTAIVVEHDWGTAIDLQRVEGALKESPDTKVLAFVHAETSTGVLSDAQALCALAQQHDCLSIVDAVTSLGGVNVEVDSWGADAVYSGTQKCLSCPPGISPVTFSDRAAETVRNRTHPVGSWFLDLNLVMAYWGGDGGRTYHHTAPVNAMYGLHEALLMLQEEGLKLAHNRHSGIQKAFVSGIEAMGLTPLVDVDNRLPPLTTVCVPDGIDEAATRAHLLKTYNLEIGAGLGPLAGKVWRIGLMGHSARMENVLLCLTALEDALIRQQAKIEPGAANAAAIAMFDNFV